MYLLTEHLKLIRSDLDILDIFLLIIRFSNLLKLSLLFEVGFVSPD